MQVLSDLYGESDDGLESDRDDVVYELESETEESIVGSETEEELTESSDGEEEDHSGSFYPFQLRNKKLTTLPLGGKRARNGPYQVIFTNTMKSYG